MKCDDIVYVRTTFGKGQLYESFIFPQIQVWIYSAINKKKNSSLPVASNKTTFKNDYFF